MACSIRTLAMSILLLALMPAVPGAESVAPRGDKRQSGYFGAGSVENLGHRRWIFKAQGAIEAPPAQSGGVVFAGSRDGFLYAVDSRTGSLRWRFRAGAPVIASPSVGQGTACITCAGSRVYAVREADGQKQWQRRIRGGIASTPLIDGDAVFVGGASSRFYALDLRTGRTKWSIGTPHVRGYLFSSSDGVETVFDAAVSAPAVSENRLYFHSFSEGTTIDPYSNMKKHSVLLGVFCVDAGSGRILWKRTEEIRVSASSHPVLGGGAVLIAGLDGVLHAFDFNDGKRLWKYRTGGTVTFPPATDDDFVYVVTDEGNIHAVALGTGVRQWSSWADFPAAASPSITGDRVFLRDQTGRIIGMDARTGRRMIDHPSFWLGSGALFFAGGQLLVGSDGGELAALPIRAD